MIVAVGMGSLDWAIRNLKKKFYEDGLARDLKLRGIAKLSERKKAKAHLAEIRQLKNERKKGEKRWRQIKKD